MIYVISCLGEKKWRNNICYLPGGRSVWEKTVPEVLSTVLKTKGTVFSHTDRPRPVNNLFMFSVCLLFFRWDVCKSVSLRLEEESGNKIL